MSYHDCYTYNLPCGCKKIQFGCIYAGQGIFIESDEQDSCDLHPLKNCQTDFNIYLNKIYEYQNTEKTIPNTIDQVNEILNWDLSYITKESYHNKRRKNYNFCPCCYQRILPKNINKHILSKKHLHKINKLQNQQTTEYEL